MEVKLTYAVSDRVGLNYSFIFKYVGGVSVRDGKYVW